MTSTLDVVELMEMTGLRDFASGYVDEVESESGRHVRFNPPTSGPILVLIFFSFTAAAGDGRERLQLIQERNLSTLIHELPGAEPHSHSVSQLKISDDDRWIAIDLVAGHYGLHEVQHHHLLLLPTDLKTDIVEQFDCDYRSNGSNISLSPDGGLVVIENGADILSGRPAEPFFMLSVVY